ncbi:biotin operon repressor [Variovorax boronicumulans]|uniref:helix-turn-helix domain-containing protein n=1 Tax=Variovorax boronicumulans TaxID=436515 RepID=UPI002785039C|nr:helix-turn-helix domain-containing protein [Variovorax boronicumulans]MDQ0084562.1 biotin operon repressor [Variovorax boronicumulans]
MTTQTNGGWIENIPQVEIELLEGGNVRVTDKSDFNQDYSVDLHPIHLRLIAEKMGLVREMSASEADALRMVDKLARRIGVLQERILQLDKWLWEHPDPDCADIGTEIWFSAGTLDLANEFLLEIGESRAVVTPRHDESRAGTPAPSPSTANTKAFGWALRQPLEKSSTKFLLVAMAFIAGDSGRCSASVQELADKTSQDRKTVLESLKRLTDAGLIVDTGERSGATKSVAVYQMATNLNYEPPKTAQLDFNEEPK